VTCELNIFVYHGTVAAVIAVSRRHPGIGAGAHGHDVRVWSGTTRLCTFHTRLWVPAACIRSKSCACWAWGQVWHLCCRVDAMSYASSVGCLAVCTLFLASSSCSFLGCIYAGAHGGCTVMPAVGQRVLIGAHACRTGCCLCLQCLPLGSACMTCELPPFRAQVVSWPDAWQAACEFDHTGRDTVQAG
jgi:hypothetical protein